jgi:hypothetical protein
MKELKEGDLSKELWREYEFEGKVYKIENPQKLYFTKGGSTHRVVDSNGVVHCLPAPGWNGCVLRWKQREGTGDVTF